MTRDQYHAEEDEAWRAFVSAMPDFFSLTLAQQTAFRQGHKIGHLAGCELAIRRVDALREMVSEAKQQAAEKGNVA